MRRGPRSSPRPAPIRRARSRSRPTPAARSPKRASLPGDWLVFGAESAGLSAEMRARFDDTQTLRLPLRPGQRSLNLSNAVAVAVFEAWRQNGYAGSA